MFIRLIKKWYALLLSVFWARKCAGCGQISEDGLFCSVCREVLLQPLWLSGREALDGVGMLFRYNGALKTALQNVKFKNRRDILELLAEECCRISVDGWPESAPVHKRPRVPRRRDANRRGSVNSVRRAR